SLACGRGLTRSRSGTEPTGAAGSEAAKPKHAARTSENLWTGDEQWPMDQHTGVAIREMCINNVERQIITSNQYWVAAHRSPTSLGFTRAGALARSVPSPWHREMR